MTVSTTASVVSYSGNGVTTAFSFPYEYRAAADLKVVIVSSANVATLKTITTHYTVSGTSDSHGGYSSATVTMVTAPASGETLVISREPAYTQETNPESESNPLYAIHNALDLQMYLAQHFANRGVKLPIGAGPNFASTLPDLPDDDSVVYYLGPSSDRSSLSWLTAASTSQVISSAWAPVVTAGTLAAGLSAAGLGTEDSPTFTGLTLSGSLGVAGSLTVAGLTLNGRLTHSPANAAYDLSANVLAAMHYFSSGTTISVSASKQLDVLHWTNTLSPGNAALVHFGNCNLTVDSSSHSAANVRGWVANIINQGPATCKAMYGRAEGTGASSGALASHTGQIVPGASTAAAYGMQLAGDSTARKVDYAYQFQAVSGSVSLDYGVFFADGVAIAQSALQMYADGAGNLWLLKNASGSADLAYCSSTGEIYSVAAIRSAGATQGVGYATGAGGAVTQLTNRSTGVTLNKICGAITTDSTSLAAEASATFTVTNSAVAATDVVVLSIKSGANGGNTAVTVAAVAAGSFDIKVSNNNASGGTAETGAIVINFAVIKAVAS